jgi:hypothetical protein
MDALGWGYQPAEESAPMPEITKSLSEMTPVEIDTELSRLWNEEDQAESRLMSLVVSLHTTVGDKPRKVRGVRGPIFNLSWEKVLELALVKTLAPYTEYESAVGREVERTLRNWAMARRKLDALTAEIKVYTDEYVRRGRWNRVFLALSHDGHAHKGTECPTCHRGEERTRFAWLVQYSDKTEAEIVADAGWRACTTCYPSAPVGDDKTLPTKMYSPDEEQAAKAREERKTAQAKRAADQAAKGITAPDGSPLRDRHGSVIKTERTAVIEATEGLSEKYKRLRFQQLREADPALSPFLYSDEDKAKHEEQGHANAMRLIEAIAHKRGTTTAEVLAELEPKAQAKARRDVGGKEFADAVRRQAPFQLEEYEAYKAQCEKEGRKPFEVLGLRWPKF